MPDLVRAGGVGLRHLEGMPSPYAWRRGEWYPVFSVPLDQLDTDPAPQQPVGLGRPVKPASADAPCAPPGPTSSVDLRRSRP